MADAGSMSLFEKIKLFFRLLLRSLSHALWRSLSDYVSEAASFDRITLTNQLYVGFTNARITLVFAGSGGSDVIEKVNLSIDEAREIFSSIERACRLQDVVKIKVGDLPWTIDARPRKNADKVMIAFGELLGRISVVARRDDLLAAVTKFGNKCGKLAVKSRLLNCDDSNS